MQTPIAIYHMNCNDGTAAAAVFLRKFPEGKTFPLSRSATEEDIAPVRAVASQATHIYFLDCEIGYEHMLSLDVPITIIDHHISKHEELTRVANATSDKLAYVFDNEKSGASLAWDHFFPNEKKPQLIQYIEDVDIWRLVFGDDSLAVREYASMYYNQPNEMLKLIEGSAEEILTQGRLLLRYARTYMQTIYETVHARMIRIGTHDVPAFNVTVFQSGLGNRLSLEHTKAVLLYTVEGDIVRISTRSCEGQSPTALDIALLLGGGGHTHGHTHAAGASVPLKTFLTLFETRA